MNPSYCKRAHSHSRTGHLSFIHIHGECIHVTFIEKPNCTHVWSSPLILYLHLPCYTLRSLTNVSSTTRRVHTSFLERHKVTASKSHVQKSFAAVLETEASSVCFLETHIVPWLQSLMWLCSWHIQKGSKKRTLLWTFLHTHFQMSLSAPIYAGVPRQKWQRSEIRRSFC